MQANSVDPTGGPTPPSDRRPVDEPEWPRDELYAIAERILEGERINWEDLPPAPDQKSHRMREQLRVLDTLTDFHRSSQRSGREGEAVPEPQRWGHLDIVEPIGGGSFGTVYQAWDPKLERSVALKILQPSVRGPGGAEIDLMPAPTSTHTSPRTMARTIHEARLLAKVNHPNVVTVFGADAHDELIGIWMELIEGETLWRLVRDRGPLGAREALAIGHDLLGALSAVHGAGILHRDVKAQNVMRARGGRIVLMDFGLGMEAKTERDRSRDWAVGTALYAAPERLRGEEATVQSDLYSLGVLLYFLVTARHPVEGGSFPQLLEAHERGDYRYLRDRRPDLPRAFVEAIERAIRREPEDRYRSAGEMDVALAAAEPAVRSPLARTRIATARLRLRRPDWHRAVLLLPTLLLVAAAFWLGTLGRFSVEAALFRGLPHGGQASLTARDAVGRNDSLFLLFQATCDLYLYILEWDQGGSLSLLYPNLPGDGRSPLAGHALHRLPGPPGGLAVDWSRPKTPGGLQFLFIASPRRLARLEAGRETLDGPGFPLVTEDSLWHSLAESAQVPGGSAGHGRVTAKELFRQARPLGPGRETVRGLWIRKLELAQL